MSVQPIQSYPKNKTPKLTSIEEFKETMETITHNLYTAASKSKTLAKTGRTLLDASDFLDKYEEDDIRNLFKILIDQANIIEEQIEKIDCLLIKH